ncbi:MAG: hypothetical protein IPK19_00960 [Chloroflexi bacterium]|nr:hypothetical protein [Chloroflexota bacterium]
MAALMDAVETLGRRHTLMVIGLPGDRQDEDLLATMRATVTRVDSYILHDLQDPRERAQGEVPRLISQAVPPHIPYRFAGDQREAISAALVALKPGDRLIVIADIVDEAIAALEAEKKHYAEDGACLLSAATERAMRIP